MAELLWSPSQERNECTLLTRFVRERGLPEITSGSGLVGREPR